MFEAIYADAESGGAKPPWDYGAPRPQLVEWVEARGLAGGGREALVVGVRLRGRRRVPCDAGISDHGL